MHLLYRDIFDYTQFDSTLSIHAHCIPSLHMFGFFFYMFGDDGIEIRCSKNALGVTLIRIFIVSSVSSNVIPKTNQLLRTALAAVFLRYLLINMIRIKEASTHEIDNIRFAIFSALAPVRNWYRYNSQSGNDCPENLFLYDGRNRKRNQCDGRYHRMPLPLFDPLAPFLIRSSRMR